MERTWVRRLSHSRRPETISRISRYCLEGLRYPLSLAAVSLWSMRVDINADGFAAAPPMAKRLGCILGPVGGQYSPVFLVGLRCSDLFGLRCSDLLGFKRASSCNSSITRCIRRNSASTFTKGGAGTLVGAASALRDSNRASAATKLAISSAR